LAFFYTDITESGVRVWCGEDGVVHFGDTVHQAPSPLLQLRAVNVGDVLVAIGQLHIGGQSYLCNSLHVHRVLGPNHGERGHGLCALPDGSVRVVWIEGATGRSVRMDPRSLADLDAQEVFANPNISSQGLLDVTPTNLVWTDFARVQVIDGLQYGMPLTRGDWTVGQDYQGVNGLAVLASRHSTRQHFVAWRGETQVAPRINSQGDVAVSGIGSPDTLFRTLAQFEPAIVTPEDPEDPMPDPAVLLANLERERARYPDATIGPNECVDILNRAVWPIRNDWALLKKDSGNFGVRAEDGAKCSVDYVVRRADRMGGDVFSSAGSVDGKGPSTPQGWSGHEEFPADRVVLAVQPSDAPPDPPDDDDDDPPVDADVLKALQDIASELMRVSEVTGAQGQHLREIKSELAETRAELNRLRASVDALKGQGGGPVTFPDYEGSVSIRVLGTAPIALKPKR
jgi:hypothetical protein